MRLDNEAWPAILFADPTAMKHSLRLCACGAVCAQRHCPPLDGQ